MSISGVGQSYYQNNIAMTKCTKNVNNTEETGNTQELSEAEKLETFKKEIWDEINSMSRSSSISWSINITDEAFERMMKEPEFKEKTMKLIKEDAAVGRPPITACVVTVDVNGYSGYSYMDQEIGNVAFSAHSKDKNNFYTKKAKSSPDGSDLTEYYEKQRRERELQKELRDKEFFQHKRLAEYWNKRQSAAASYEANIFTADIGQGKLPE